MKLFLKLIIFIVIDYNLILSIIFFNTQIFIFSVFYIYILILGLIIFLNNLYKIE